MNDVKRDIARIDSSLAKLADVFSRGTDTLLAGYAHIQESNLTLVETALDMLESGQLEELQRYLSIQAATQRTKLGRGEIEDALTRLGWI